MHKKISMIKKEKKEKKVIKNSKNNINSLSSFKKKISESLKKKAYLFKALFAFQNFVLVNYIFINLFIYVICKNKNEDYSNNRKLSLANEIKIKIIGKGNQYVLNSELKSKCSEISINGIPGTLGENS